MSLIKDPSLADQGRLQIEYAASRMPALLKIRERFAVEKPLAGLKIGMALHVTKETAVLVDTLKAGGATVAIASCNPLSTQDDTAAALAANNTEVFAKKGETKEEYYDYIARVIATKPHITIDDGCDLVTEIHTKHPELIHDIIGGCEETTTGVIRLRAMEKDGALKYPIIAVNDNKTKHLFDNYYGTGQSVIDGIIRATNILFAGKTVVIAGYGDCGKGIALRAKGHGAIVVITEISPFRALQATMDGYRVLKMEEAAKIGDIFITATGNKHVLVKAHFQKMKSGAVLANAGHFNIEIDINALDSLKTSKRRIREFMEEYQMSDGRKLHLLGEGRLINLAAAEGHPSEVMDLSFAGQALACQFLANNKGKPGIAGLKPAVLRLPEEIDDQIAELALKGLGVTINQLTSDQNRYLTGWQEGT